MKSKWQQCNEEGKAFLLPLSLLFSFSKEKEISTIWGLFLPWCRDGELTCELTAGVCVSVISTELFCEGREEERGKKERDKEKKEFILYCNTNTRHLKYSNNEAHVASISKCRRAAWEAKGKRDWLGPKNCQQNPYFIMTKEDQKGIFRKQHD